MSGVLGGNPPGVVVPLPAATGRGLLRLSTPEQVAQEAELRRRAHIDASRLVDPFKTNLVRYILNKFEEMRRHRQGASGWEKRLIEARRMINGEYPPDVLAEIRAVGGSEVYSRIVAVKCRGATALLRDIYLSGVRPWEVRPTPEPTLPEDVTVAVDALVESEAQSMALAAVPATEQTIMARRQELMRMAREAARQRAERDAKLKTQRLEDILAEGGFDTAMAEMLADLPVYPFACIKGPVVRVVPRLKWVNGQPVVKNVPKMFWERVAPEDLWFTPGASNIATADIVERVRFTGAELAEMIGLPGFNESAIRAVLREYGQTGYTIQQSAIDEVRARAENRESPSLNESNIIEALLFTGTVPGSLLREYGMSSAKIPDADRYYSIQAWVIGSHIIKVQLVPSPSRRHPYFITSFEKLPGTIVGNAIPDILKDIQAVCNAALRALCNNMGLASGPQVVVNEDMLAPGEDPNQFYPWKRWRTVLPQHGLLGAAGSARPIEFFQPNSNAHELLTVYEKFSQMADELSAIPRYITGSERLAGAARTSSGLAMLMNNASKILQTVANNIDQDIIEPMLWSLHEIIMLTDTERLFTGDEDIVVHGVAVALQRETQTQRRLEFLQLTANPIDAKIIGLTGRGNLLRAVAESLDLGGHTIVPSEEELRRMEQALGQMAMQGPVQGAPGGVKRDLESDIDSAAAGVADKAGAGPFQQPPGSMTDISQPRLNLNQKMG